MINTFKNFGAKKIGGLILIIVIIIAFGFGGFGGGFSTNNQNNIAKINKKNITTEDFMKYLNESGISQQAVKDNIDNGIIEELVSGLISSTLIDLEIKDYNISINKLIILKKIKENKNFLDENNIFQRTKYEKFLLSNNVSAPMFELQLKNRALQKNLFDLIGAGTVSPNFIIEKIFEEENKSLEIEYFGMENLYKKKNSYDDLQLQNFLEENIDQLKREYIDFKYTILNPKNLIESEEFNQEFFDKIDNIENEISKGSTFEKILKNLKVKVIEVNKYVPTSIEKANEDKIYFKRSTKIDILENDNNFLLYSIVNKYNRGPDLNNKTTKDEINELVFQKGKFDLNRDILEKIKKKEFNNNKFIEMSNNNIKYVTLNSINDNEKFKADSIKILYSLPVNSFTLVGNKQNEIFLVKLVSSKKNRYNKLDKNYLEFIKKQNINKRKNILSSYDQLLNNKYNVKLNQRTIDKVKNYFK